LAQAQEEQMLLAYKQTIISAFQQVSSALVAYQKNREFREQQEHLTSAAKDTEHLSMFSTSTAGQVIFKCSPRKPTASLRN
jgi:hypothetical protein